VRRICADFVDRIAAALVEFTVEEQATAILGVPLSKMKAYEQRKYFNEILKFTADRYFGSAFKENAREAVGPSPTVSAVAGLLHNLIKDNELLRDHLVTTLTRSFIPALDGSLAARRSVIAALGAADEGKRVKVHFSGFTN
jgi:telomere length regulation protein